MRLTVTRLAETAAAMSSWVQQAGPPSEERVSRQSATRHWAGRKAIWSTCRESRRTVRARYLVMDRASSGSCEKASATSSRSMGTISQAVRATAEETRGSPSKKAASPKRFPAL